MYKCLISAPIDLFASLIENKWWGEAGGRDVRRMEFMSVGAWPRVNQRLMLMLPLTCWKTLLLSCQDSLFCFTAAHLTGASSPHNSLIGQNHWRRSPQIDIIPVSPIRQHMPRPHGPHPLEGNTDSFSSINHNLSFICHRRVTFLFFLRFRHIIGLFPRETRVAGSSSWQAHRPTCGPNVGQMFQIVSWQEIYSDKLQPEQQFAAIWWLSQNFITVLRITKSSTQTGLSL